MKKSPKKLNRKGFSMVELVIVIAIMAVLVAVLAPTYITYVEKSRVSTDNTTADEIKKAAKLMLADDNPNIANDFTITWTNGSIVVALVDVDVDDDAHTTTVTAVESALKVALDITTLTGNGSDSPKMLAREHNGGKYTVTVTVKTGAVAGEWE